MTEQQSPNETSDRDIDERVDREAAELKAARSTVYDLYCKLTIDMPAEDREAMRRTIAILDDEIADADDDEDQVGEDDPLAGRGHPIV